MQETNDKQIHYKMYKKGRFWLFAGITLVTLNLNTLISQADEGISSTNATGENNTPTSTASQLTAQTITLDSGSQTDVQASTASTATSQVSAASEATSAEKVNATSQSSSADAEKVSVTSQTSSASTAKVSTASQTSVVSTEKVSTADQMSSASTNAKSVSAAETTATEAKTATSDVATSKVVTADTDQVATVTTVESQSTSASSVLASNSTATTDSDASTATDAAELPVVDNNQVTGPNAATSLADQLQTDQAQSQVQTAVAATVTEKKARMATVASAEDLITGTNGTAPWSYDPTNGVLTISAGTLANSMVNPWKFEDWFGSVNKIVIEKNVVAGAYMTSLFANMPSLKSIEGLNNIDTSNVISMQGLFYNDLGLTSLDLSSWNTSNVTTMQTMFDNDNFMGSASSLTSLNLSGWDTTNVTNMAEMFTTNPNLTTITGIEGFNTKNVTSMSGMFSGTGLTSLDLSLFDSTSLTDASSLFAGMNNVTNIKFGANFTLQNTPNVSMMFQNDSKLTELDLSNFNIKNATQNRQMFQGTTSLKKVTLGPGIDFSQKGSQPTVSLPSIPSNSQYTGKWVNVNDAKQVYTSDELVAAYSGTNAPLATFVWQEASKSAIVAKDTTVYANRPWSWADSVTSLIDANGNPVDVAQLYQQTPDAVTVSGNLDLTTPGEYTVTFTYAGVSTSSKVTVVKDQDQLVTKDSTVYAGDTWHKGDNFGSATNNDGTNLTLDQVSVSGTPDFSKPGTQTVTYTFVDSTGRTVEQTATITVLANQTDFEVKDSTLIMGENWQATDNIVQVTDKAGNSTDKQLVSVNGQPDLTKPGVYQVHYTYGGVTKTVNITVIATTATIDVKGVTLTQGAEWNPQAGFVGAKDVDGSTVDFSKVTVSGAVDPKTVGDYSVTYSYTDMYGNKVSQTVTVTVKATTATISAKDVTLTQGAEWNPQAGFVGATDADGNPVAFQNVQVTGAVDSSKAGSYDVTYQFTDKYGNVVTQTVKVNVIASQAAINVKDMTVIAGANTKWHASDNFVSGTDMNGHPLKFSDVEVVNADTIDLSKAGQHTITYRYTDQNGNEVTATAMLTVKATQAMISTKPTTVDQGTAWSAGDNFVSGTDAEGQPLTIKDIVVTGDVDTSLPGIYTVTYRYTDSAGNVIVQTALVTVKAMGTVTDNGQGDTIGPDDNGDNNSGHQIDYGSGDKVVGGKHTNSNSTQTVNQVADQIADQTANQTTNQTSNPGTASTVAKQANHDSQLVVTHSQMTAKAGTAKVGTAKVGAAKPSADGIHTALPQTSEVDASRSTIVGALLLGLSSLGALIGLKRRRTNK